MTEPRRTVLSARVCAVDPKTRRRIHPDALPFGRVPVWALVLGTGGGQDYYLANVPGTERTLWGKRSDLVEAMRRAGYIVDPAGFIRER